MTTTPGCIVDGCTDDVRANDMCSMHYYRWYRTGRTGPAETVYGTQPQCTAPGCDEPHRARGYCRGHYYQATEKRAQSTQPGKVRVKGQQLPDDAAQSLVEARQAGDREQLGGMCLALAEAGWTWQAIATPLDVGRERVRQWAGHANEPLPWPEMPRPPRRTSAGKPQRPTPSRATIRRLKQLHTLAGRVPGWTRADSPEGQARRELSAQLHNEVSRGVTATTLARILGVTRRAVELRLEHAGYKTPPPSLR